MQDARTVMRGQARADAPPNRRRTGKLARPIRARARARGYDVMLTQRIGAEDLAPMDDQEAYQRALETGRYVWVAHVVGGEGEGKHEGRHCVGSTLYLEPHEVEI